MTNYLVNNQSYIPSPDNKQLTLNPMIMTTQVVETSVILETVLFRITFTYTIETFYLPTEYETLEVTQDELVSHSRQKKEQQNLLLAYQLTINLQIHSSEHQWSYKLPLHIILKVDKYSR